MSPRDAAAHRVPAGAPRAGQRSLVVAPQWIGDAVMAEPLLRALALRGERLTVAALPWVAPVVRAFMGSVEAMEVVEWPFQHGRLDARARWSLARSLRGRFDRAYVLPNSIKSALVPWFAGIPVRIGYLGEGRRWLLNHWLPNPGGRPAMVPFYGALAGLAAPPVAASPLRFEAERPRLEVPAPTVQAVTARFGLQPGAYRLFAPGAEYGPAKCWPAEHYAELALRLAARDRLPIRLLGSPKETATCEGIVAAARAGGADIDSLAGRTSLSDAIALIAGARSVVSNDSGLMHVAAALGIEQVAVFGSTSPEHTPPLNPRAQVVWLRDELGLDCMPCFERQCRYGHTRCLTAVTPERVESRLAS